MIEALKDWDKKIEEALQEYRMTYTDVYGSPDKMEEFFKQQHKKFLEHYISVPLKFETTLVTY